MSDTCGPTSGTPLMRYDLDSSSWRTCEATSLWDLEMSSPTFPEWGMTLAGVLYELPTPERPTAAPASSSLPTPTARDWKEQSLGWTWQRDGVTQEDSLPRALTALLPTPVADHSRGLAQPGTDYQSLPNVAMSLLPTPTAQGSGSTPESHLARKPGRTQVTDLTVLVEHGLIGASTPPPSPDGSSSSAGPHQPPLFPA